jgi:DNA/RNA-binding domain of Phe-tRNA-synthetase-like protein
MALEVAWDSDVSAGLSGLAVCVGVMSGVRNEKDNDRLRLLKETAYAEVKKRCSVEALKDDPTVRAYRDFYWRLGVDPTKTRPAGEALLRRILNGNDLPSISAVVDAYNLASMKTIIPISGFDRDCLNPPFQVRFARNDETFIGIGMATPMTLIDKLLVFADQKQVLCIYPYRDSNHTKIAMQTHDVMLVGYGASGVAEEQLKEAVETALSYIRQAAGGETESVQVFGE